jgi:hypothetical protein
MDVTSKIPVGKFLDDLREYSKVRHTGKKNSWRGVWRR